MEKIIILHEYDIKSHFETLYKSGNKNKIIVEEYIVLSKIWLFKKLLRTILKGKNIKEEFLYFLNNIKKQKKLKSYQNRTLIVGIAPYDNLMLKYKKIFEKNNCIYFTSWEYWDGSQFPKGNMRNKVKFEKVLQKCFYGAACVSKKSKNEVKNLIDRCEVVNHSININEYRIDNSLKEDKIKRFIFLGQYIERKGIYDILNWVENTNKENFEFTFAGYGPLENIINNLTNKDNRIINIGKLSKQQIKKSLGQYDYLVLPSKKEPFGIVILEALAAGIPVIASNVVGPSEIIDNNKDGFLFNNYNEFCKIMDYACDISRDNYLQLKANAKQKAIKYDCDTIINKWISLIKS